MSHFFTVTNSIYQIEVEPELIGAPDCIVCEQLVKRVEKEVANDKSKVFKKLSYNSNNKIIK